MKAEGLLHIPVFTSMPLSLHLSPRGCCGEGHTQTFTVDLSTTGASAFALDIRFI